MTERVIRLLDSVVGYEKFVIVCLQLDFQGDCVFFSRWFWLHMSS